jgi:hypothetical protein
MTTNLQRALRLLEDGFQRAQWAGGGSPQGTGLWSFRGDDGGGGGDVSGGDSGGGGGGGGADGLLRVSGTGPTERRSARARAAARRAAGVAAPCAVARRGRDAVAAARALIQFMSHITSRILPLRGRLTQRVERLVVKPHAENNLQLCGDHISGGFPRPP